MERPDHISYSQIETGKCLLKYYHLRLIQDVENKSLGLSQGKLIDEIITEYSLRCLAEKSDGDFNMLEEILDRKFDESNLDLDQFMEIRQSAMNFGERGFDYDKLLDCQREFSVVVGKDSKGKDVVVTGKIDRVDCYDTPDGPCLETIDYKNHLNVLTEDDVRKHRQLCLYDYVNCMHLHRNEFALHRKGIYFTPYNFMRWDGVPRTVGENYGEFDNIEKWLIKNWERLQYAEEFPAERGAYCWQYDGCPVMLDGKCPAWSEDEVERFRLGHTIEDKARLCRMLDHQRKQALSELKALVPVDEMIEVDGENVGFKASQSYKYDLPKLLEWLEKKEKKIEDGTISKTDAEKVIKNAFGVKKIDYLEEEELDGLHDCKIETISNKFVY